MEKQFTQSQLVNTILRVGHGDLAVYADPGLYAAKNEPELFAHLIAWNAIKGQVRDSQVALPVIALRGEPDDELFENAAAHLCLLSPRDLVRAVRFHKLLPNCNGGATWLKRAVRGYLYHREYNVGLWDRSALQHRKSMKTLYAMNHIKPSKRAQQILFDRQYPPGSVFEVVKQLKNMNPQEAAGTILNKKIPFLIAVGALGGIKDKTDVILALIEQMSPAELINNTAALERWGVMDNAALKSAYQKGLEKKSKTKTATLKAGKAAEAVKSKKAAKALSEVQERQIDKTGGIEGDWLVLGDRSGSMHMAIELARQVAAFLARTVKGQVHLVLFNTTPAYFDVTGKNLEQITEITRRYRPFGGTAIGSGVDLLRERGIVVNGIAICSDGGDNSTPLFSDAFPRYCNQLGCEPTVYLWHVPGESNHMDAYCKRKGIPVETFEIGYDVDYYSIPQIALAMRTGRYALVDEILETNLLTFDKVFGKGV